MTNMCIRAYSYCDEAILLTWGQPMKRMLICGLLLLMAAPLAEARRKEKKVGEIVGDLFRDNEYGLEIKLHQNWKPKIGKEGEKVRITLMQRNYGIPSDYLDVKDYTLIPIMIMYVDTTTLGAHAFIDSLTSATFKSSQKNAITKEFEILSEPELVPMQRTRMDIAGESALLWKVQAKYKKVINVSTSSATGKRVDRKFGGAIAAVKINDKIVLFYVQTEWEFYDPVLNEVLPMIESLKVMQEDES